jgi:phosphoserine aminotransferase
MERLYNFSAGPAVLPREVLEQARDELVNWQGCGMSVMEMSHRGKEYMGIQAQAEADLRELMGIPANYKVLFLQGGASSQFAMVPMNLYRGKASADYLNTGEWSKKAIKEAKKYGAVNVVASSEDRNFSYAPAQDAWKLDPNAAYVHYTPNETIGGVEIFWTPETGDIPLVADMSSTILSRPIDVSKFGLIYAGAQKNIGPAGLTLVIVRDDLIGRSCRARRRCSTTRRTARTTRCTTRRRPTASISPVWCSNCSRPRADWRRWNRPIAPKRVCCTTHLDATDFYNSPVARENRSLMNIPFTLKDAALDEDFLKGAKARGLVQLKGHRSVGGMRASIYNAMPVEGVQALVDYMNSRSSVDATVVVSTGDRRLAGSPVGLFNVRDRP